MYCVAILPHYYAPDIQGGESVRFASESTSRGEKTIYFESVDEARAWIDEQESESYLLEHNESGRPDYIVVDDMTADFILSGRNGDLSNYDWTDCECTRDDGQPCGECQECISHMIAEDRDYIRSNAIE